MASATYHTRDKTRQDKTRQSKTKQEENDTALAEEHDNRDGKEGRRKRKKRRRKRRKCTSLQNKWLLPSRCCGLNYLPGASGEGYIPGTPKFTS